jgi:superfamily I DNA/RNA helicase
MSNFSPTSEQVEIVAAAKTGEDVIVEAGAGTGKTSTLALTSEALPQARILYLAFSKALQVEASGTFPANVEARTAHSLAYRNFCAPSKHKHGKYARASEIAQRLSTQSFRYGSGDEADSRSGFQVAAAVMDAVSKFCASADRKPTRYHIDTRVVPDQFQDAYATHVLPYVQAAWTQIADPKDSFPFIPGRGDNCYLKLWSLSDPQLPYDVVLFDEAQDADPAIAHVVEIQENTQRILVGDRAQAIYGWRGAIDAMSKFNAPHHLYLTQSFRFGDKVAEQANRWLEIIGTPLRLTGTDSIQSTVEALSSPDAILCRTNAGVIESAMQAQSDGLNVAIAGGTATIEAFIKAADKLMHDERTDYPELATFRTWNEVTTAVEQGEADDVAMMVRLVNNYGIGAIEDVCQNSINLKARKGEPEVDLSEWAAQPGNLIVSTAHKAKGLEWGGVRIHGDFKAPKEGGKISVSEAMLIYVAVTRAKQTLDHSALAWLDEMEADIAASLEV